MAAIRWIHGSEFTHLSDLHGALHRFAGNFGGFLHDIAILIDGLRYHFLGLAGNHLLGVLGDHAGFALGIGFGLGLLGGATENILNVRHCL